ncbi:hypothetical protein LSH36_3g11021 [Paralvinella palmiformis]|uniref:Uncharacterized protein n=1 Tax=Paralvinella palmiformis TaxID=53620 RepID=A0AAD9KFG6_9ANNE|nr:hypothetical protein LSH36_3g11021 [Paralvinella palmiformis]
MPDKRKIAASEERPSKKAKTGDLASYLPTEYSSEDDSDGEISTLPAFDLPNFDLFADGGQNGDRRANGAGLSKNQSDGNGGIIFLSDLSQLPKPINFNTPTVLNSVVIGAGPQKTHSQVLVVNKQVNSGPNMSTTHLQPVVLTSAQTQPRSQSGGRVTRASGGSSNALNSHMSIPITQIMGAGASNRLSQHQTRQNKSVVSGNQSHITTLPANMSATNIMQHVMAAAQQAAKNIRAAATQVAKPQKSPQPAVARNTRRTANARHTTDPLVQNNGHNGHSLLNGNVHSVVRQNITMEQTRKWKPYSDILNQVVRKLSRDSIRRLGINPGMPLNLKQMHNLLRNKFSTQQIYDMCLWDMEHPDASLLEIAITNAFT